MTVRPGDVAPAFSGVDDAGERVTSEELRGHPALLHFFVLAWTGV